VDRLCFAIHVVHQDVLTQRVRCREVRLASTDRRHAPHEGDEVMVSAKAGVLIMIPAFWQAFSVNVSATM
jgi:hypothetical protein